MQCIGYKNNKRWFRDLDKRMATWCYKCRGGNRLQERAPCTCLWNHVINDLLAKWTYSQGYLDQVRSVLTSSFPHSFGGFEWSLNTGVLLVWNWIYVFRGWGWGEGYYTCEIIMLTCDLIHVACEHLYVASWHNLSCVKG